jgi:hypothetical protein
MCYACIWCRRFTCERQWLYSAWWRGSMVKERGAYRHYIMNVESIGKRPVLLHIKMKCNQGLYTALSCRELWCRLLQSGGYCWCWYAFDIFAEDEISWLPIERIWLPSADLSRFRECKSQWEVRSVGKTSLSLPCLLLTHIVSSRPEATGRIILLHFVIFLFFLFHILSFLLYAYSSFPPLPSSHCIYLSSSLPPVSTPPLLFISLPILSLLPYPLFSFLLFLSLSSYFIPSSSSYSFPLPLLPLSFFSSLFYTISSIFFISYSIIPSFLLTCFFVLCSSCASFHDADSSTEWQDDSRMINWKGYGRKPSWLNLGTIPEFFWRDWRIPRKTSVRIADVAAEIRTEYLPNTNLRRENCL